MPDRNRYEQLTSVGVTMAMVLGFSRSRHYRYLRERKQIWKRCS